MYSYKNTYEFGVDAQVPTPNAGPDFNIDAGASRQVGAIDIDPDNQITSIQWTTNPAHTGSFDDATIAQPNWTAHSPSSAETVELIKTLTYGSGQTVSDSVVASVAAFITPDTESPVITVSGNAVTNIQVGFVFTPFVYSAVDNRDVNVEVIISGDTIDTSVIGSYVQRFNANDQAGNQANEVIRTVNVLPAESFDNRNFNRLNIDVELGQRIRKESKHTLIVGYDNKIMFRLNNGYFHLKSLSEIVFELHNLNGDEILLTKRQSNGGINVVGDQIEVIVNAADLQVLGKCSFKLFDGAINAFSIATGYLYLV